MHPQVLTTLHREGWTVECTPSPAQESINQEPLQKRSYYGFRMNRMFVPCIIYSSCIIFVWSVMLIYIQ